MKYTYKDKKTYKLKNKLKILLTILLAALITTTGYILSKNVFSKLDYEYFNEITQDGINIKVVGGRGVIPDDSTLKIEKVSREEKNNVDASINDVKNNNMNTVESYTYDIKILDSNNNEIEPSEEIQILFTNDLINNKNLDTNIYHTSKDEKNNLNTEVLKGEIEGKTITTKTDSFSYYTVEFTYNNLQYSMEGDSEIKLSAILEQVGLEGEVELVIGSNDNLFSFEKKNNEWYVKAHQAFQTTEWMKVTIDDIVYEITVTDAVNYTITYNSGSDGEFEGGSTTNIVSYSIPDPHQITKYSHTPNVDDTGLQNGNYANNLNTNDVVTISGATTLTVDIYYNGESVSYDWLSVWAGNYPSYTASSNRTSTGYVTTDMGAPDNTNKFGGSQSDSYTVNGNSLTNMGHCTLTIQGDSVTFGFKSDNVGAGYGYGYYAIVTGVGQEMLITSGTYKEPIPNDSDFRFKEWSQNLDTITADTTVTAIYEEDLLDQNSKGTYDGVDWKIKGDGTLIIGKAGEIQTYKYRSTRSEFWPWYQYRTQITGIDFAGTVNGNGSHKGMFRECSNATSISNINKFNTLNITNMSGMFYSCSKLTYLDVTNFNTSNVVDMGYMFYSCSVLTSLDVTNFNTSSVTDMGYMFYRCFGLTNLDVTNFNTSNVTNMRAMFYYCNNLTSLDLTSFDTSRVINMRELFYYCNRLTSLILLSFNTSSVINMGYMFYGCDSLTSLDVTNFDTSSVTDMEAMFSRCSVLTSLDLTNFDTSNVTEMGNMFYSCSSLTNLDVTNLDTSIVISMNSMFQNCSNLINLNLTNLDTSSVVYMQNMFSGCGRLTNLDLSGFDTSRVTNMSSMFYNCSNLTTIYASQGWNIAGVTNSNNMFSGSTNLVGSQGTIYDSSYIDKARAKIDGGLADPGYLTYKIHNFVSMSYAVFDSVDGSLKFFKDDVGKWYNKQVVETKTYYYNIENLNDRYIIDWSDKASLIQSVSFEDVIMPKSMSRWFSGFSNSNLVLDFTNLDTSNVKSMNYMFEGCSHLTSLDLTSFDTSNVVDMGYMFYNCSSLTSLNITEFDTSNVRYINGMFRECVSLTNLDLSSFDTSKVTLMSSMFYNCSSLTNLDVTAFDTSSVTNMGNMFYDCSSLASLDVTGFITSKVTDMKGMFYDCSHLTELDVTNFDTSCVTNMQEMFRGCINLTSLDVTGFNTSNVTRMNSMFESCGGLTSLDVTGFDTSSTTNMYSMFESCNNLTSLDVTGFDTSNVVDMGYMFCGCNKLTSLDVTGFDTSSVTDMEYMFASCISIRNLDVTGFDTSNVTDMDFMFASCRHIIKLDLISFDTSSVIDMYYMFGGCYSLVTIYVSDTWNIAAVTNSDSMFMLCINIVGSEGTTYDSNYTNKTRAKIDRGTVDPGYLTYRKYLNNEAFAEFDSVTGVLRIFRDDQESYTNNQVIGTKTYYTEIETIENSTNPKWYSEKENITNVILEDVFRPLTAYNMFSGCINLISLDLSGLDTSNITNMYGMFSGCTNLTSIDVTSFDTSNVIDMGHMFSNCGSLTNLDMTGFDTSKVLDMSYMFSNCSSLTDLNMIGFLTLKVTNMEFMFSNCSSLTNLNLSKFNTTEVTNMKSMFYKCSALTNLDVTGFDTSKVIDMSSMFDECSDLTSLDVVGFDTSKITNISKMFYNCVGLTTIYVSDAWNTSSVTLSTDMFSNCVNLVGGEGTVYNSNYVDKNRAKVDEGLSDPGYFTYRKYADEAFAEYDSANGTLKIFRARANKYINEETIGSRIYYAGIEEMYTSSQKWFPKRENITNVIVEDEFRPLSAEGMFMDCYYLLEADLLKLDTSRVKNMTKMFYNCYSLASLDVTGFDTSNVTQMGSMFYNCSYLKNLDVTNFDTSNVRGMAGMFSSCSSLKSLDVSGFDTTNVEYMSSIFASCGSLKNLDVNNFDTSNVRNMGSMFAGCRNLVSLNLSNFDTSIVTNMQRMFYYCEVLTELDLSNFDTSKITDMSEMFYNCDQLTTIYVSDGWNAAGVTSSTNMFSGCTNLVGGEGTVYNSSYIDKVRAKIDGGSVDPGYMTYKEHTFDKPIAYAVFDSSDGSLVFFKDEALKWYNKQVVGTKTYYYNVEKEDTFYASNIDWSDKKNLIESVSFEDVITPYRSTEYWFSGFSNSNLVFDFTNFDTSKVTIMRHMFSSSTGVVNLDLSNFDTSNVTDMEQMFYMCRNLISIDLSGFNTGQVIDIGYMFAFCSSLTSLDLSSFDTSKVVGDWGFAGMFRGCTNLISVDLTSFDTSGALGFMRMFDECNNLISLDLSSFDTSNVTDMSNMFYNCDSIKSIDVSSFDTSNVINMTSMFRDCDNLETIYVSNLWNTDSVTDSDGMFSWTRNIVGEKGTTYYGYAVDKTRAKIDGGESDPGYLTYKLATYKLMIAEEVRGSIANINKNFTFTLSVIDDGGIGINGDYEYTGTNSGNLTFTDGNATFDLKHGENMEIKLPRNCEYIITQTLDEYTLSKTNDIGTLRSNITASFIDTLEGTTPTGIFLDLIPYILLLFGSIFGIFWLKKFAKI